MHAPLHPSLRSPDSILLLHRALDHLARDRGACERRLEATQQPEHPVNFISFVSEKSFVMMPGDWGNQIIKMATAHGREGVVLGSEEGEGEEEGRKVPLLQGHWKSQNRRLPGKVGPTVKSCFVVAAQLLKYCITGRSIAAWLADGHASGRAGIACIL